MPASPGARPRRFDVEGGCHVITGADPVVSHEHSAVGMFTGAEVAALRMPAKYRKSIASWLAGIR